MNALKRGQWRGLPVLALGLLAAASGGCNYVKAMAYLFGEQQTKTVPAAYPYLTNEKVAIVVRADMETLFEYPHVQWELADHIRVALEANVKGVTVIDPRKVVDVQRRNGDWQRRDPALLGQDFGADKLLEIDLTQYTTREPDSPHLYRGHIIAAINVYNTAYPNSEPAFKLDAKAVFPEGATASLGMGDREVRRGVMEAFAQEVANKFYERKVKAE